MSRRAPYIVAAVLISASAVFAQGPPDGAVAPIQVSSTSIRWTVQVPSAGVTVTVMRPDGEAVTKEFRTPNPTLTLQDLGVPLEDGTYTWELVVTPPVPAHVQQKMQQARANNDDAAARKILREAGLDRALVESGAFSVLNGSFVLPSVQEPASRRESASGTSGETGSVTTSGGRSLTPALDDQVIPDDLIVQGSICVGTDCVNNENFGFDTIRLKENNTRIKFDDTSTVSGFPATDWQLTANDSASGGANKFSIEDITSARVPFTLRGGAPTNSLLVASTGRVGLRTSTPVLDLHIATGDTPGWRLEQNNSSGFTAQTWDIAGNEANFFIRDVTGGSTLPFRIRPGAPTSSIDIAASGNVGIGTASPSGKLHVVTTGDPFLVATDGKVGIGTTSPERLLDVKKNGGNTGIGIRVMNDGTAGNDDAFVVFSTRDSRTAFVGIDRSTFVYTMAGASGFGASQDWFTMNLLNGNIGLGNVTAPGHPIHHNSGAHLTSGGVWTNASSRDSKQDVSTLDAREAMETLHGLSPVKYAYKAAPQERHAGFIAEDVPDLVATADRKGLSPMDIVAVLTKVVQEQQKTIDELSARLEKLEAVPERE
ncbi:MAG TPA: tail fiber domain-containing protein [Thermoanaerobaculia bacterium]|nr:tail fiber domain-containing protein [Thermoanaerobaculia bacterium]